MTRTCSVLAALIFSLSTSACAQNAADRHAINQAISAAPDDLKEGAAVYGYNKNGTLRLIRKGTNELVCTSDDPENESFETACFQKDLFDYISRGRVLKAEGMNGQDSVEKRKAEIEAGTLPFVKGQATQYIRYGDNASYDEATGEVLNSQVRFVIYIPGATPESTGLPTSPMAPGAPFIMDAGTFRAHIMIVPPENE
ncbi:MAG: hypothetical protein O3B41_01250 [Bacteroidetes bacterium]|nr:hypothetical protein [Bacteroidota bacterium]